MAHDGLYGPTFDAMMSRLDATENAPQTGAYDLDKVSVGHAPATGAGVPPPSLFNPLTLPLVQLGPHAAGGTLRQRAAAWLVSRTGIQTLATSLGVPSLMWLVGEVSAAQSQLWTAGTGVALVCGGMVLGAVSLDRKFGTGATLTGAGAFAAGFQTVLSASPSLWAGCVGWLLSAGACAGARIAYANGRKEPDAKVRILEGQARLVDARTLTEMHKAEARMYKAKLDQLKLMQAMTAAQPVVEQSHGLSYTPVLRGDESGAETALLYALTPGRWADESLARGLDGTSVQRGHLTDAGIELFVRLDGRWSPAKLTAQEGQIRALASVDTRTRVQIEAGPYGDVARILIRTRSASDGMSLVWHPGQTGFGVDEITGEVVHLPLNGTHKLVAGATNMGKSVSWRPLMMQAVADPLWAGVLLDPKRLEARLWEGKIRTEGHQRDNNDDIRQAIYDGVSELVAEMHHRQEVSDVTQWIPTREYPNLLVIVEEGRQLIQMSKDKRWADVLDKIDDLYTLARATGVWILWATQYPSRSNGGITAMVSENSMCTVSLTVDGPVSDRVIYGENAAGSGWEPSKLEGVPGRALVKLRDRKPNPVRIFHVTDEAVRALPDAPGWKSSAWVPEMDDDDSFEHLVPVAATGGNRALVAAYVEDNPGASHRQIASATGVPEGSVGRLLRQIAG